MTETTPPYFTTVTPIVPDPLDALADWERSALTKLRVLRQARKNAILWVTDAGAILVFRGEQAGRIAP